MSLLPVSEAQARILAGAEPKPAEDVPLAEARGRTLAAPVAASRDQPPFPASAMDGYAVRAADTTDPATPLRQVGVSAAGHRYAGAIGPGETVRIFTGAPVPDGADAVLIQENTTVDGDRITATEPVAVNANIRPAGLDFRAGDALLDAGTDLGFRQMALAASAGAGSLSVRRRPVVALIATGDELVAPGDVAGPDQIFASSGPAVAAILAGAGAEVHELGIARDDRADIAAKVDAARAIDADILLTFGGVSVGDHDLVNAALTAAGMTTDFWKIAMRPGKPLMFGRIGDMRVIGLPGNPVSSLVCALLFVRPLVDALLGRAPQDLTEPAVLAVDVPANGPRAHYMRATRTPAPDGGAQTVAPLDSQDSSLLAILAKSDCLLIRDVHAPASRAGETCRILPLG